MPRTLVLLRCNAATTRCRRSLLERRQPRAWRAGKGRGMLARQPRNPRHASTTLFVAEAFESLRGRD